MELTITHIGTASMLLTMGPLRLLTDPVFDPPGGRYAFGWGTGSTKLTAPAVDVDGLGPIDAVLLSHDHHEDNLDRAGRALLPRARRVLTTMPGARRLGGNAEGMRPWEQTTIIAGETQVTVTATPSQHGPLIARPFAGATLGFVLEWAGQHHGVLYLSGDTVFFHGIDLVGARFPISVAVLHLGGAGFPITGPIRFTMGGLDGVKAVRALNPRTIIPIHYEGWGHFTEGREELERSFAAAGLAPRVCWLPMGAPTVVEV